jgi:hypothetical protein
MQAARAGEPVPPPAALDGYSRRPSLAAAAILEDAAGSLKWVHFAERVARSRATAQGPVQPGLPHQATLFVSLSQGHRV